MAPLSLGLRISFPEVSRLTAVVIGGVVMLLGAGITLRVKDDAIAESAQ